MGPGTRRGHIQGVGAAGSGQRSPDLPAPESRGGRSALPPSTTLATHPESPPYGWGHRRAITGHPPGFGAASGFGTEGGRVGQFPRRSTTTLEKRTVMTLATSWAQVPIPTKTGPLMGTV